MGVTKEEILQLIIGLEESVDYWKYCQPWIDVDELNGKIKDLKDTLSKIE